MYYFLPDCGGDGMQKPTHDKITEQYRHIVPMLLTGFNIVLWFI